jgi:hypothetical protein
MKKTGLLAAMAFTVISATAQDYKTPLEKTFLAFDTTMNMTVKVEQSNKLALIAKKWDAEWVTHYYLAYSKAQLSYMEKDAAKRDAYLDEAEKEMEDAVTILKKDNDETYVLAAMIANARMAVDGMNRWQKYGPLFSQHLESAKGVNAENPRMYYLNAVSKFFTPKQFGGGKKAALPYFEKAEGLFTKEMAMNKDISQPHWGKDKNAYFMELCKKEDKE